MTKTRKTSKSRKTSEQVKLEKLGVKVESTYTDQLGRIFAFCCLIPLKIVQLADYQRGLVKNWSDSIKANFDPAAMDPISVSFRDGRLWVFDGQHRLMACLALAEEGLHPGYCYATIHVGLSYQRECQLFYIKNQNVRMMNGWTKFKAAYRAGNPLMIDLIGICDRYKLTHPVSYNRKARSCDISSPGFLLEPHAKGGYSLVEAVCRVLHECWRIEGGPVDQNAKETTLMRALTSFLRERYLGENPLPWKEVRDTFKRFKPHAIAMLARNMEGNSKSIEIGQYKAAIELLFSSKFLALIAA